MTERTIRAWRTDEQTAILAIINAVVQRYRGVIRADCWHEPYTSDEQLQRDVNGGLRLISCPATARRC